MPAVTMKDIAQDLGLSIVTISKVLRDHPDIGAATRERVLRRVKELNYTPNLMARGLVTGRSHLVALIVPDLLHSFFVEIAVSISTELRKQGYSLLISWTVEDPSVEINEIQHLLGVGIDAMIIATSANDTSPFNLLHARNIPYVLLDRDLPELKVPFVGVDDVLVGKMATQHLIDIGCKRIAHISGPSTSPGRKRLEGYRAALKEAGMPERPDFIIPPLIGPSSFKHGREAIRNLLQVKPRIDGVFCYNDPLALGVYEGIRSTGIRVPQEIAIVGCGNQPVGAMAMHPLTTIDQNTEDLGRKAARAVLELLRSPDKSRHRRRFLSEPKLLIRGTSLRGSELKSENVEVTSEENSRSRGSQRPSRGANSVPRRKPAG